MSRPRFFFSLNGSYRIFGFVLAMLSVLPQADGVEEFVKRPNVLFIMCDDLNDWVLDPPGHPRPLTPNMDRLRAMSVSFTNAHVTVPVCGPSRKTLFSGLYPQTIGSYGFSNWAKTKGLKGCVPIPLHFKNHGYETYGTGKLIHEGKGGDFYTDYGIGVDYGPWPGKGGNWTHPTLLAKYGDSIRHHDFSYGPLSDIPTWKAKDKNKLSDGWFDKGGKAFQYISDDDRDLMPDEISAEFAVNVLQQSHDKPFFLAVGFARPHTPLFAPKKYFDSYPLESINVPPILKGDLDDCSEALRNRWLRSFNKFSTIKKIGGEKLWKQWIQAYMACVTFVDDQLGTVLNALEASPYADNTIIIFTSDHGYHLGEKASMQKWHLWEEATRVPLFIHVPGNQNNGQDCDYPIASVDIYPTLAQLCSLPMNPNEGKSGELLDGFSLVPFLEDPDATEWDGPSVAYMTVGKSFVDAKGWDVGPHHSVRSHDFRYTLCTNGEEELYDHRNDPNEWTNLAHNPEYDTKKSELRAALLSIGPELTDEQQAVLN